MQTANKLTQKQKGLRKTSQPTRARSFFAALEIPTKLLLLDRDLIREFIQDRRDRGADRYDEVWEGVYIVSPLADLRHQELVAGLSAILFDVVNKEGRGRVFPGANVSDRRTRWRHDFRTPDVVVVLDNGRAVDCTTHFMGEPDFLIEIESPGDETEEKIAFYSRLGVRELLLIRRDSCHMLLCRHDGRNLVSVLETRRQSGKWLASEIVPLAFRRKKLRGGPRVEVQRTDGVPGHWTV
jgi:Uma2 family endonuclease